MRRAITMVEFRFDGRCEVEFHSSQDAEHSSHRVMLHPFDVWIAGLK